MRSMLVVVGRTRKAEECLEVAVRIALETGSVLHAVHPLGPGGPAGGDGGVLAARIRRRIPPGVEVGSVRVVARATHEAVAGALLASSSCPTLLLPPGERAIHPGAAARPTLRAEAASPAAGRAELPGETIPTIAAPQAVP